MGILVNRPREFPSALAGLARRFVRNIWDLRGGGLYACGYVISLVWLEIKMFYEDLVDLFGPGDAFGDQLVQQLISFVFRFAYESLINSIQAFAWPAAAIELYPPWSLIVLIGLFFLFPKTIKPPLERWLFHDDETKSAGIQKPD